MLEPSELAFTGTVLDASKTTSLFSRRFHFNEMALSQMGLARAGNEPVSPAPSVDGVVDHVLDV